MTHNPSDLNTSGNVLVLLDAFHVGGITSFMKQHISFLIKLGKSVTVIGSKNNLSNIEANFPDCHVIVVSEDTGSGKILKRLIWACTYIKTLFFINLTQHIETVYLSTTYSALFSLCIPFTWTQKRIYAFCGDYALEMESSEMSPNLAFKIKNTLRYIAQLIVIVSVNKIITFSHYAEHLLVTRYPISSSRISIIPAAMDFKLNKRYTREKGITKLLAISRLEPRKGIDLLLTAMSKLQPELSHFHLTVVCAVEDDSYFSSLFTLYESLNLFTSVTFLHKADTHQIEQIMAEHDLFIMPSRGLETFGFILLQAVSNGLISICTPVGSLPEILEDIDPRLLTNAATTQAIYERILWFSKLTLKEKRLIQTRMKKIISQKYRHENIEKLIARVFNE